MKNDEKWREKLNHLSVFGWAVLFSSAWKNPFFACPMLGRIESYWYGWNHSFDSVWSFLILTVYSVFHFQIAGIILDNFARGRTRHIWFTISGDLIVDARRSVYSLLPHPQTPAPTHCHHHTLCVFCNNIGPLSSVLYGFSYGGKRSALIVFLFSFFNYFPFFYVSVFLLFFSQPKSPSFCPDITAMVD